MNDGISQTIDLSSATRSNITGDLVALGPWRRDLIPLYQRWDNDLELLVLEGETPLPSTETTASHPYDHVSADDQSVRFTICERATGRPIGRTALHGVDHKNRIADFSISIGERECWGKGYGTEATRIVLRYGFAAVGLHNIMLSVYSFNQRAIHTYERAGFRHLGRQREAYRVGDRAYDVIYVDCLSTEQS